jgi:integrase
MGSLYRRKLSTKWWCKYYVNGRPVRESTGTSKETEARCFLKAREGRVATGQPILPRVDRIRYEEAAADLRQHYEATGSRDIKEFSYRVKHLDRFFVGCRIGGIGQPEVNRYVSARRVHGATDSTIRRELGTLTRMLRIAFKNGKLLRLPLLEKPKEGAPRRGFFEREQYEAVRRRLRPDLQVAIAIAYAFGWRMQSEVLTLARRQIDLDAGTLRLEPGSTKNGDGRVVYLPADLKAQIAAQIERVRGLERRPGRIVPYLFPYLGGRHEGERIRDFRKAWSTACKKAAVAGQFRHDLRRTAVRNLVRAGVPERVAMTVTGHKTRSVFDRYDIVSPADLQEVARKLTGTFPGTVPSAAVDSRP